MLFSAHRMVIVMKKIVACTCFLLIVVICLTGCNIFSDMLDSIKNPESMPKTKEMVSALSEQRMDDAKALMHPDAEEVSSYYLSQMSSLLNGRKPTTLDRLNININTSPSFDGSKTVTEEATYIVNLDDGNSVVAQVIFISDDKGSGFASFVLSIGI